MLICQGVGHNERDQLVDDAVKVERVVRDSDGPLRFLQCDFALVVSERLVGGGYPAEARQVEVPFVFAGLGYLDEARFGPVEFCRAPRCRLRMVLFQSVDAVIVRRAERQKQPNKYHYKRLISLLVVRI